LTFLREARFNFSYKIDQKHGVVEVTLTVAVSLRSQFATLNIGRHKMTTAVSIGEIGNCIYFIRGSEVILDSDLARLYAVTPKRLNEQVKRNPSRFPQDFMFQLIPTEYDSLRSQFATLNIGRGKHRKYLPFVFTEQGASMLSAVLKSERAVEVILPL
jgi:hypothetical protein